MIRDLRSIENEPTEVSESIGTLITEIIGQVKQLDYQERMVLDDLMRQLALAIIEETERRIYVKIGEVFARHITRYH